MLYFSCVRHSIPYFQNICQEFDEAYQHSMKAFLNTFVSENDSKIIINRAFMDKAFQNAKRPATVLTEASCNRIDHSQHSVQLLTSTPIGKHEMKKPSPPTPKSVALEWKLKNLNAMLESATTENINQEKQIEQLLQNVKELQEEKKRYQSKISALQLKEMCSCAIDSAERTYSTSKEREQLQKQLEHNSTTIEKLQEEISKTQENATTVMDRYLAIKKQYAVVEEENQRMRLSTEDLKEEINIRDNINQNLTEAVNDLRRFIRENHIPGSERMELLESSFDFLDKSLKNVTSDDSQCYDSENLASTVVDIKLKEKEHENEALTLKMEELEGKLQDMQKSQNEMFEQQKEANARINQLLRSLAESEEQKTQLKDNIDKHKAEMENLICQLESQKKVQSEERERLRTEMDEKTTELKQSLEEVEQIKTRFANELEKEQVQTQELNRKLGEGNKKMIAVQQTLADVENEKSQLIDNLGKSKSEIEDLIGQLEFQKKVQIEEGERLQNEMMEKTTEIQQSFDKIEESKRYLADELQKAQTMIQDLNCELVIQRNLQVEMNEKTVTLRQALADAECGKSQLLGDLEQSKAQNADLVGQLESQKQTQKEESERLKTELNEKTAALQQALANAEKDKSQLAEERDRLKHNESYTVSRNTEMLDKISALQQSLDQEQEKSEEINCQYMQMKKRADDLDAQCTKLMQQLSEDRTELSSLQKELASKDAKLVELNVLCEEKQKQFDKTYQDNEILSVKLYKARSVLKEKEDAWTQSLQDSKKAMEEKLRDARIEFDSTMEKMKERMKELHKEVKTKLECDNQGLALTADGYRRKVDNLEIRCSKLQKQLAEMNERNLEVRKENQHLHIRLKTLEEFGSDRKSLMLPNQASLRSNLRMEDEEGELFNNMYLADMKSGRCVSPGPTHGGVNRYSELTQRNSMLLPHLRTNYVALAPDCEPTHDDTRDNMSSTFDDSSTGLISRRKVGGITSYKRPGPPTPSKRAGRLSLNGVLVGNGGEVQYKDALRDANTNAAPIGAGSATDVAAGSTRAGRTKTPGKFKQMISSSSLLNNFQRDEGNTSAMPKTAGRRSHQWETDCNQVVAKRKRLQRKMLFDSNRCLTGGLPCQNDLAGVKDETSAPPLYTILERSASPNEKSQEQDNECGTRLAMTRTTTTDITTSTTAISAFATATNPEPVVPLSVSEYSFRHPYGSNRYNILRMQVQSREKRRQLYDETRKVAAKGITMPASVSIESATQRNEDHDSDSASDITLYLSFTSDTDSSRLPLLTYTDLTHSSTNMSLNTSPRRRLSWFNKGKKY
uniref:Uncharacterized protein n=1 Tax=Anopheles minimus TaxID=112268 RepID=A0A182W559_9DIPT